MGDLSYSSLPNNRLKYSGKELDEEGGLHKYHFGWRDFDPELARWNVVDPARQFASPYVYAANNPIGYYDEDGRWVWFTVAFALNYTSYGIINDDWGIKAIMSGGQGAVMAGVGFGVGSYVTGGLSTWGQTAASVIGGAAGGGVAGASNALLNDGNVLEGMGAGIVGGAIGGALRLDNLGLNPSEMSWVDEGIALTAAGGLGGGITAGLLGGDIGDGFIQGATGAAVGWATTGLHDWLQNRAQSQTQIAVDAMLNAGFSMKEILAIVRSNYTEDPIEYISIPDADGKIWNNLGEIHDNLNQPRLQHFDAGNDGRRFGTNIHSRYVNSKVQFHYDVFGLSPNPLNHILEYLYGDVLH